MYAWSLLKKDSEKLLKRYAHLENWKKSPIVTIVNCFVILIHVISPDPTNGEQVTEFVKNGGCALSTHQELLRQDWKNQIEERTHYFHKFPHFEQSHTVWNILSTSPYLPLFHLKFMHMEQAGIMAKLARQYSLLKREESEKLDPLKLEHFYIIFIGIFCGLFLAVLAFVLEIIGKKTMSKVPVIN